QGAEVLESPWLESVGDHAVVTRTIEVGPSAKPLRLPIGRPTWVQVAASPSASSIVPGKYADGSEYLLLTPEARVRRFRLMYGNGGEHERADLALELEKRVPIPDLRAWTKPGAGRYPTPLVTRGEIARDDAPYVVDTLTVPYDNPHRALFFTTGLDFLP